MVVRRPFAVEPLQADSFPGAEALRGRLDAALEALSFAPTRGPKLRKTAERTVKSVLMDFARRGVVEKYFVRCNEETNLDSPGAVVVEVIVKVPTRVRQFEIRLQAR
ncbi:MAG: hypothetical protein AUK47_21315 [Deltaproteobacteria bacterium CG2_30_63_29]|nr:MAG: hypothetical protein AUK47_21315 [Deltaproteobacteria bacterium CG2_30_63_29]PJB49025.1 MAG: hypothetical protein CO108_01220 [Deltaproteobacteria bacterium CG_4_9_14_3_um_filter_63_12]